MPEIEESMTWLEGHEPEDAGAYPHRVRFRPPGFGDQRLVIAVHTKDEAEALEDAAHRRGLDLNMTYRPEQISDVERTEPEEQVLSPEPIRVASGGQ